MHPWTARTRPARTQACPRAAACSCRGPGDKLFPGCRCAPAMQVGMVHGTAGPACRRMPLTPIEIRVWRPFFIWQYRHMFVTLSEDLVRGRMSSGRPACRLACREPAAFQVSAPRALRMTEENENLVPGSGGTTQAGHRPAGHRQRPSLRPGAGAGGERARRLARLPQGMDLGYTSRIPPVYLPYPSGVPGRRNPQASGEFDLCPSRWAPCPWPGRWGRPLAPGSPPGRPEVGARSTGGTWTRLQIPVRCPASKTSPEPALRRWGGSASSRPPGALAVHPFRSGRQAGWG